MSKLSFCAMSMAILCGQTAPSHAADMIEGYQAAPKHHHYTVSASPSDCGILRVEYRHPYEPHTDYVQVCTHPKQTTILSRNVDY
ncbi:hypothetical protein [Affinirhizobium pseudoryzae]|uniref:hypothetical protein n=1 Tax=Allorhizobium pseudoryzae TaxID=379684 RepID=UPI0013ECB3FB|nr:hypothetical protein [Allorhizobium pseudoryzae]